MGAAPVYATLRDSLNRAVRRLSTPPVYLGVLGGLQLGLIWQLHAYFGLWLPILATVMVGAVLALILIARGQWRLKLSALYGLVLLTAIVPTAVGIVDHQHGAITMEHDGMIQIEAAVGRLMQGQPIYGVDWSDTALRQMPWVLTNGQNPALHHQAYFPLTILAGVPVKTLTDLIGVGFDYRMVLIACALIGLAGIAALPISTEGRFMITTAIFVNPFITLYLWSGRTDVEFLAFVFVSLALLARGHPILSSGALGVAIALKPFALFAAPFLLLVLFARWRTSFTRGAIRSGWRAFPPVASVAALAAVPLLTIVPFLLTNARGFYADTVLYTNGGVPDAYPINGYGFSALLLTLDVIARRTDAFPFGIFQFGAMVPTLWFGARSFLRRPTMQLWMAGYAALFLAFAFFARFFNDSYVGVAITLGLCIRPLGPGRLLPVERPQVDRRAA